MMTKRLKVRDHEDRKRRNSSTDHKTSQDGRAERRKRKGKRKETGRNTEMGVKG